MQSIRSCEMGCLENIVWVTINTIFFHLFFYKSNLKMSTSIRKNIKRKTTEISNNKKRPRARISEETEINREISDVTEGNNIKYNNLFHF